MSTDRDLVKKHLGLDVFCTNLESMFLDDGSIDLHRCVIMTNQYPKLNDFLEEYLVNYDDINKVDCNGCSTLHWAAFNSRYHSTEKTVQILINAGINVNLQDYKRGTALHLCAFYSNTDSTFKTVEMLIQADADVFNLKYNNKAPIDYFSPELIEYCQIDKEAQTIGIKSGKLTKVAKK